MNFLKNSLLLAIVFASGFIFANDLTTKIGAQAELNRIVDSVRPLAAIDPVVVQNARQSVADFEALLSTPNLIIPADLEQAVAQAKVDIQQWNQYLSNVPDVVTWRMQFEALRVAMQGVITALVDAPAQTGLTAARLQVARDAANAAIAAARGPIDSANKAIVQAQQAFSALASSPIFAGKGITLPWQAQVK
ncbi:hypothetical protein FJ366_02870 [Candidatus Dependentiae bacterium]|nr:hypothetical protein [Candidatus Dependentiae bacterium]